MKYLDWLVACSVGDPLPVVELTPKQLELIAGMRETAQAEWAKWRRLAR